MHPTKGMPFGIVEVGVEYVVGALGVGFLVDGPKSAALAVALEEVPHRLGRATRGCETHHLP